MQGVIVKSKFYISYLKNIANNKKNRNICFIHIPKTGGKSIISELKAHINIIKINKNNDFAHFPNFGAVTFGHVDYLSLLNSGIVSEDYHRSSYKFAIVRNPYSRIASLYNYLSGRSELEDASFDHFLDQVSTERPPVGMYNKLGISQSNPQLDWITGSNGELYVDDVFKLEKLDEMRNKFQQLYGVDLNLNKQKNISKNFITVDKDIIKNKDRIKKINEIYKNDFVKLGYEMM